MKELHSMSTLLTRISIALALIFLIMNSGLMGTGIRSANAHLPRLESPVNPLDQRLETCMKQNPGTTSERHCMEALLPMWEARILHYYTLLGGDQNHRLKAAQHAWQGYAAAQTHYFETQYDLQGTLYALFFADARLQLIRHRALQLEDAYDFSKEHH